MNTQEAKFILQAYRPGGEDANDPQFAEALQQVKNDPELAKWFAEQTAFDSAMSRALQQVMPPDQLRENILAGGRVTSPAFWSRRAVWWAMAASFVLLLSLGTFWLNSMRFAVYMDKMAAASANSQDHVDAKISDLGQIQAWLADRGVETNFILPIALSGLPTTGCRILDWHGHKISMICYMLEGPRHVDLYVAEKSDFMFPPPDKLHFGKINDLITAGWSRNDKVYVMIGQGDEVFFRKYLEPENVARAKLEAEHSAHYGAISCYSTIAGNDAFVTCDVTMRTLDRVMGMGWTAGSFPPQ